MSPSRLASLRVFLAGLCRSGALLAAPTLIRAEQGASEPGGETSDRGPNDAGKDKDGKAKDSNGKDGDDDRKGSDAQDEVDTENLFGFTEGSETGKRGEQEILLDSIGRFSKRRADTGPSRYRVSNTKLSYQFDPTDNFSIDLGIFADARSVRNIADLPDKSYGTFDGASAEFKYRFLKASNDNPLGLAVELRPRYARILPVEGQGADIFDMESLLQLDVQLVPDKVWYGSNLSFEPSVGRLRSTREVDRSSTFLWSHAVVARVTQDTFVGPELRYLRAYDGAFLNRFEGHAVFLGPALDHRFGEKAFLTLAHSTQIAGHDRDPSYTRRAFDLTHFERHAVRVKLGLEF
ncbi:hypothetical protein [Methylobacterium durans]|uniref:DUF3570 domain-containing protein n=1 Tax=Methylobacterium durans TaxID=2202825 RepID=A0A2U8WCR7_9HYPH|nr:hypothetical protein [Methylobacterium durans]AWN43388.1 hypothetical protein DK389_26345 [Methylobacterium durans]